MNQSLSSVALVSTFYEEKKNYFDVYLPFIVKSCNERGTINLNEISDNLRSSFGFKLPINVIKTILCENESVYFELRKDSRADWDVSLASEGRTLRLHLLEDETSTERDLERILEDLRHYLQESTGQAYDTDTLRVRIQEFFHQNIDTFSLKKRTVSSHAPSEAFSRHFVKYLGSVDRVDPSHIRIIEKIWKGMILLNEMGENRGRKRADRITDSLEVFIDTNIVFSLIGLHNQILNKAIYELFSLIKKMPKIRVFILDTTISEFERILSTYEYVKHSFQEIEVDSVFYFMKKKGYDSTRILQLRENILEMLKEKEVEYRETSGIDESILNYYPRIHDKLLKDRQEKNIRLPTSQQRTEHALERSAHHDAYAISYVLRRKNKRTSSIHACKAIFLTSSSNLCENYSKISRHIEGFPAVIRWTLTSQTYSI